MSETIAELDNHLKELGRASLLEKAEIAEQAIWAARSVLLDLDARLRKLETDMAGKSKSKTDDSDRAKEAKPEDANAKKAERPDDKPDHQ